MIYIYIYYIKVEGIVNLKRLYVKKFEFLINNFNYNIV